MLTGLYIFLVLAWMVQVLRHSDEIEVLRKRIDYLESDAYQDKLLDNWHCYRCD